jgi:hypothetical protein
MEKAPGKGELTECNRYRCRGRLAIPYISCDETLALTSLPRLADPEPPSPLITRDRWITPGEWDEVGQLGRPAESKELGDLQETRERFCRQELEPDVGHDFSHGRPAARVVGGDQCGGSGPDKDRVPEERDRVDVGISG